MTKDIMLCNRASCDVIGHHVERVSFFAYEEQVHAVVAVAIELEAQNYHDIDRINDRKDNMLRLWNYYILDR